MKIQLQKNAPSGGYDDTKTGNFDSVHEDELQCDTDFQVFMDNVSTHAIIFQWTFKIFVSDKEFYSLEKTCQYNVLEIDDPELPTDLELEQALEFSYQLLYDHIKTISGSLPRTTNIEEFSTFDVFELKQKIKKSLLNIDENNHGNYTSLV